MPLSCVPRSFPGYRRRDGGPPFNRVYRSVCRFVDERRASHQLSDEKYIIISFVRVSVTPDQIMQPRRASAVVCATPGAVLMLRFCARRKEVARRRERRLIRAPEVQWTGARLIAVLSLLGQQQQFHAFAFASQRGGPFFASPLVDPLQPLPNPLQPLPNPLQPRDPLSSFRHAMPGNCQSK